MGPTTKRDRIWTAAIQIATDGQAVTPALAVERAGLDSSSERTATNVLRAMTDADVLTSDTRAIDIDGDGGAWERIYRPGPLLYAEPSADADPVVATGDGSDPTLSMLEDRNNHRWTFRDRAVREFIESRLEGPQILNACAGRVELTPPDGARIYRNDAEPSRPALYSTVDVAQIDGRYGEDMFDTIVFDPPWSIRKSHEKYDGNTVDVPAAKDALTTILRPGGRVISIGYDANGFGPSRDCERTEVALIHYSGDVREAYIVVNRYQRDVN